MPFPKGFAAMKKSHDKMSKSASAKSSKPMMDSDSDDSMMDDEKRETELFRSLIDKANKRQPRRPRKAFGLSALSRKDKKAQAQDQE